MLALLVATTGCAAAATVTTWHTNPPIYESEIRLTGWPQVSLVVNDARPVPARLVTTLADYDLSWQEHSTRVVSAVQQGMLRVLGPAHAQESSLTLQVSITKFEATFNTGTWTGTAEIEAALKPDLPSGPGPIWIGQGVATRFNWWGLGSAEGAAQQAFRDAMHGLLLQLAATRPIAGPGTPYVTVPALPQGPIEIRESGQRGPGLIIPSVSPPSALLGWWRGRWVNDRDARLEIYREQGLMKWRLERPYYGIRGGTVRAMSETSLSLINEAGAWYDLRLTDGILSGTGIEFTKE